MSRPHAYTNTHLRGTLRFQELGIVDQTFENYAAMNAKDAAELVQRIRKFHADTNTENPFDPRSAETPT